MQSATQLPNQLGGTLGTSGDWGRRLRFHHAPLAFGSAIVLVLFMGLTLRPHGDIFSRTFPSSTFPEQGLPSQAAPTDQAGPMEHGRSQTGPMDPSGGQAGPLEPSSAPRRSAEDGLLSRAFIRQSSVATGYVALGLLGLTLLIGPANLFLHRRNSISNYLTRDVGTWAAIFSVVHVSLGFQVHGDVAAGVFNFLDFFVANGRPLTNSFGLANWTGLAALVIVVGLLAISTDGALQELKARPWKNLQRLNYALFVLVVLHAFFYGALLRVTSPFTLLLIFTVVTVFVGQAVGIWLWRRRHARIARTLAEQPS